MEFRIEFQPEAERALLELEQTDPKKYKKILKTLALMETNLRHLGLKTHECSSLQGPNGEKYLKPMSKIELQGHLESFGTMVLSREF